MLLALLEMYIYLAITSSHVRPEEEFENPSERDRPTASFIRNRHREGKSLHGLQAQNLYAILQFTFRHEVID